MTQSYLPLQLELMTPSTSLQHSIQPCCFMLPWENNPKCGRKRSLSAVDEVQSVERPEKRARGQSSSRQEAKAAFWDSLSRVHLTRRALKELDRRNQLHIQPRTTASRIRPNQSRPLKTLRDSTGQIKRFARHGGPDLTDLRAVRCI